VVQLEEEIWRSCCRQVSSAEKRQNGDLRSIATSLEVAHVLEGTVRRDGYRVNQVEDRLRDKV
jgi:TolB-like protein